MAPLRRNEACVFALSLLCANGLSLINLKKDDAATCKAWCSNGDDEKKATSCQNQREKCGGCSHCSDVFPATCKSWCANGDDRTKANQCKYQPSKCGGCPHCPDPTPVPTPEPTPAPTPEPTPAPTRPADCSGTYQAETATLYGARFANDHTGWTGTGHADYIGAVNAYVAWTLVSCEGGTYMATFRYALASGNRPLRLDVNAAAAVDSLDFPSSGSWNTWTEVQTSITLPHGRNRVRLVAIGKSGANIDKLDLTKASS